MGDKFDLDKLEFEDSSSEPKMSEPSSSSEDEAVSFSIKVIDALASKMRDLNKNSPGITSLKDLKEVYIRGAGDCSPSKGSKESCGHWALARVNMFLRMKRGEKMTPNPFSSVGGKSLDISDGWIPAQEDFDKAAEEIKEFDLNYDFSNINELYIENYKRVNWKW